MRVKSIIIDGFKSYAHRKELADLSPHFNAITGLNGSGKSNIFDAICFVMGITNLKRVRAEDPRELIFRAGTTGVHAARVTIEFVNDDPSSAPPGYSCVDYPTITIGRQIKLGGRQQFFFNNTVSMQSKVKRFFESISLNVDNPHFMILQGTVHKLIGMRSQDILSLIEEAVGTKAFDHRRRTAETLIRNKERKMEEIDANIEGQIRPLLETMRADQEEYNKFMQRREKLEEKQRFRMALEYHGHRSLLADAETAAAARRSDAQNAKAQLQALPQHEEELQRRLMQLQASLTAPTEAAVALREEEDELRKGLSRHEGQLESYVKALKQLEAQLRQLRKEQERQRGGQVAFSTRRQQHEALLEKIRETKAAVSNYKMGLKLLQSGVQAGTAGVSLAEERQQVDLRLIEEHARRRRRQEKLNGLEEQQQRAAGQQKEQRGRLDHLRRESEKASATLAKAAEAYTPLAPKQARKEELENDISALKREYQAAYDGFQRQLSANIRNFDLDYNRHAVPPGTGEKVLGRVGELLVPTDPAHALGLMVGAQNQLLRVVVTDDTIAQSIIQGGLRQRTAFVALNQLQRPRFFITPATLQAARRLAEQQSGWVYHARDLVTLSSPDLTGLADVVFGGFLLCSSLRLAQELAYTAGIKAKAVTVEGEVAEPNGLITGGSSKQLRDTFAELRSYAAQKAPLKALQERTRTLEAEYNRLRDYLRQHQETVQMFNAAEEAAELASQRYTIAASTAESGIADVAEKMEAARVALQETQDAVQSLQARQAELAAQASTTNLDIARTEMEAQLHTAEAELVRLTAEEESDAADFERCEADAEQQATDLTRKTLEAEEELAQQQSQRLTLATQREEAAARLADVQTRARQNEETRQRVEGDIEESQESLTRLAERRLTLDGLVKSAEGDLRERTKMLEDLRRRVREAEQRHAWLVEVQGQLNVPGGFFYFDDGPRTNAILQELREIEARAAAMSAKLSQKSAILYEERRREYEELVKQRTALNEDKEAIQRCIQGIESKKWAALDRMVAVVSSIFGKLIATCLPGATAGLIEERDEGQHLSGLGVKVAFNGKAKESLSELSGGQRSLLALCLILSILRVRPAPLYILDEVDAALDPSHTQNIGRMLQLYFPHSQFLLVSLKDGMFNNANVLYHIRNTQGYSEVARVAHKPPKEDRGGHSGASAGANEAVVTSSA